MSQTYNKLVRDKIPEIIQNNGETPITRILGDQEYINELKLKLIEEVNEYLKSDEEEELADILEVIRGLAKSKNLTFDDIINIMNKKALKRGGFDEKIFLVGVEKEKQL